MIRCLLTVCASIGLASGAIADDNAPEVQRKAGYEDNSAGFGSPNTPPRLLVEEDVRTQPLFRFPEIDDSMESWWDLKSDINERHGLRFGADYTALYQHLSESLTDEDYAFSGILRAYG
jgi:hypothetical protein